MLYAGQERLQSLSREGASCRVAHRNGKHQRHTSFLRFHRLLCGINGCFGIQRIEYGLNKQSIYTTLQQRLHLLHISIHQLIICQASQRRVVHIWRNAQRFVCRTHIAQYKTRFHRCFRRIFICQCPCNLRSCQIDVTAIVFHLIISHRHPL